jgi:hypothetical protein
MAAQRPTSSLSDNKHKHKQNLAPFLCACSTHPIGSATPGISRISNSTNTNALVAAKSGVMPISVIGGTSFAKRQRARRCLIGGTLRSSKSKNKNYGKGKRHASACSFVLVQVPWLHYRPCVSVPCMVSLVMVVLLVGMVLLDMAVVVLVVLVLRIYMTLGVSALPPVVFWLRFAPVSP